MMVDNSIKNYLSDVILSRGEAVVRDRTIVCTRNAVEKSKAAAESESSTLTSRRLSRYCAPNRTETSFETPGSCIVTP
jgi:hypothetical protein